MPHHCDVMSLSFWQLQWNSPESLMFEPFCEFVWNLVTLGIFCTLEQFLPSSAVDRWGWFFHPHRTSCIVFLSKSSIVLITLSFISVVEVRCEIGPSRLRNLLVTLGRIIGISDLLAKPWAFIEARVPLTKWQCGTGQTAYICQEEETFLLLWAAPQLVC